MRIPITGNSRIDAVTIAVALLAAKVPDQVHAMTTKAKDLANALQDRLVMPRPPKAVRVAMRALGKHLGTLRRTAQRRPPTPVS